MICLPHPQKRGSRVLPDPSGQPESDHEGYSAEGPQKEEGLPERIGWDISKIHVFSIQAYILNSIMLDYIFR